MLRCKRGRRLASLGGFEGSFCGGPDCDGDGYSPPADCNDTNALINPEAFDFLGDGVDNDCDGKVDNPVLTCETIPASSPGTPTDFARAADLCAQHAKTNAGTVFDPLVSAAWGQVQGLGPGRDAVDVDDQAAAGRPSPRASGRTRPQQGKTMVGLANGIWAAADPREHPALDPAGFHLNDACSDIPLMGHRLRVAHRRHVPGGVERAGLGRARPHGQGPDATCRRWCSTSRSSAPSSTSGGTRPRTTRSSCW